MSLKYAADFAISRLRLNRNMTLCCTVGVGAEPETCFMEMDRDFDKKIFLTNR